MQIEYRILSNDIDNADLYNPTIDEYSCGSESCVYKVPSENNLIHIWKELRKAKKRFNFAQSSRKTYGKIFSIIR